MDNLLKAPTDEIIMIFNDEMNNMINQLMHIAKYIKMEPEESVMITNSKNKLTNALTVNRILCIEMYAKFLLNDDFSDFFDNIKSRNYTYFYSLLDRKELDKEFTDLVILVETISHKVDDETKDSIFGYMENLSLLATIYAQKMLTKN